MSKLILAMIAVTGIYPLIEPTTNRKFVPGEPVEVELTLWIQSQIDAGNLVNSSAESVDAAQERAAAVLAQNQELLDGKEAAEKAALLAGEPGNVVLAADDLNADVGAVVVATTALADATPGADTLLGDSIVAGSVDSPADASVKTATVNSKKR